MPTSQSFSLAGRVAFVGQLQKDEAGVTWAKGAGLWVSEPSGELHLRLRTGDVVGGLRFTSFGLGAMNDAGDVLVCGLAETSGTQEPFVLVHVDERGNSRIVIAPGSKIAIVPAEQRTVVRLRATGPLAGRRRLNDGDRLTLRLP